MQLEHINLYRENMYISCSVVVCFYFIIMYTIYHWSMNSNKCVAPFHKSLFSIFDGTLNKLYNCKLPHRSMIAGSWGICMRSPFWITTKRESSCRPSNAGLLLRAVCRFIYFQFCFCSVFCSCNDCADNNIKIVWCYWSRHKVNGCSQL